MMKQTTLAVLAAIIAAASLWSPLTGEVARAAAMKPDTFTELAFQDTSHLPTRLIAKKPVVVTFQITNHENAPWSYAYRTIISEGGVARTLTSGSVGVPDGQAAVIPVMLTAAKPGQDLIFTVELQASQQSISFKAKS